MMIYAYHSEFRQSIAVDLRIGKVTGALGLQFASYQESERFPAKFSLRSQLKGRHSSRSRVRAETGRLLRIHGAGSPRRRAPRVPVGSVHRLNFLK
jgi:hypothetical protein